MSVPGRRFTHLSRDLERTRVVYGGTSITPEQVAAFWKYTPLPESPYQIFWGEIHGHTELSDGRGTLDEYSGPS
jgi:hypothetical protein